MDRLVHQPSPAGLPAPSPEAAALIAGAARGVEARFDEVTAELVAAVEGEMPELAGDEDLRERTHATARASAELITAMAQTWTDPQDLRAPHEALEWARVAADRGASADVLLRAYRLGHARYWDLWYAELIAQGAGSEALAEATAASSAFFFRWIDSISRPLLHAYEEQRDRRARSAEAVRAETVRALLDRDDVDRGRAAARLGYELEGWHVALIAWSEGPGDEPAGTELEARTIELAQALGGAAARPLLVRDARRRCGPGSGSRIGPRRSGSPRCGSRTPAPCASPSAAPAPGWRAFATATSRPGSPGGWPGSARAARRWCATTTTPACSRS